MGPMIFNGLNRKTCVKYALPENAQTHKDRSKPYFMILLHSMFLFCCYCFWMVSSLAKTNASILRKWEWERVSEWFFSFFFLLYEESRVYEYRKRAIISNKRFQSLLLLWAFWGTHFGLITLKMNIIIDLT